MLLALDAQDRQAGLGGRRASRSGPAIPRRSCIERPGRRTELIVASTAGITGYDPQTGKENWNCDLDVHRQDAAADGRLAGVADGLVLAASGDGDGDRHMIAVKLGGKGDVTQDATGLGEHARLFPYVPCMLAQGEHLYSVNDEGMAACYVAKTGEEVWSERLGSAVTASPVLVDGKIYAVGEDGKVYVFAGRHHVQAAGQELVGEPVSATPGGGRQSAVHPRQEHLFCIGKPGESDQIHRPTTRRMR